LYSFAINEIIIRANVETELCQAKLETEESGRVLASLQGYVAGYRKLISFIAAAFHLTETMLENTGDTANEIPDLDDNRLLLLDLSIKALKGSDAWAEVQAKVDENIERIKCHLLFGAEKSRDLDIGQGQYKATTFYTYLFDAVEREVGRRKEEAEKKRAEPGLPFDEEEDEE
jgi:predicted metal-dependent hydrolase